MICAKRVFVAFICATGHVKATAIGLGMCEKTDRISYAKIPRYAAVVNASFAAWAFVIGDSIAIVRQRPYNTIWRPPVAGCAHGHEDMYKDKSECMKERLIGVVKT